MLDRTDLDSALSAAPAVDLLGEQCDLQRDSDVRVVQAYSEQRLDLASPPLRHDALTPGTCDVH